ncbi:MAG: transcription termination factor Rho [Ornithinimicrobium sp.]|uniref:transcription termination factor Rho n=1 Tax=Ornithinimicrobium sp. TaxID=1977084 RepID=UPI003D9AE1F2
MTETTTAEATTKSGALSAMRLGELQDLAGTMGISVSRGMRKADLVSAIRDARGGPPSTRAPHTTNGDATSGETAHGGAKAVSSSEGERRGRTSRRASADRGEPGSARGEGNRTNGTTPQDGQGSGQEQAREGNQGQDRQGDQSREQRGGSRGQDRQDRQGDRSREQRGGSQGQDRQDRQDRQGDQSGQQGSDQGDDDERGGRGRRRNRQRGRDRKRGRNQGQARGNDSYAEDQQDGGYSEEDVLVPVGGVLDVLDSYAFIRTTGYLPGTTDVYVPLGIVRKNGLRKGDAVTGAIKAPADGEPESSTQQHVGGKNNRGKFNALVRLDTVNGQSPEQAQQRPEFGKLTPLYPQDRLRLETADNKNVTNRIIDLVAPIGKGQRGLIVSPPKAGKTLVLQSIANAITINNPEAHLMVVLVDERPEEVTDMQRTVKGEVVASTFDRPADDHTTVAELAIERAKRLVELGGDVVVLLDSITRLGRAYNNAAPSSGRILSGGVDSNALYPPKRFFGAARNIEDGGSLTILATALVETGSKMDEVIFEEFKGTGNMELRLSRQLADRRIFPAVDVNPSGTRREEILMGAEELKVMWKLRRVLSALDSQQGIELLLDRLRKTRNNYEFLTQVQQTSSIKLDDED